MPQLEGPQLKYITVYWGDLGRKSRKKKKKDDITQLHTVQYKEGIQFIVPFAWHMLILTYPSHFGGDLSTY